MKPSITTSADFNSGTLEEMMLELKVTWAFQLHALKLMQQRGNAWFTTANGKGTGCARLYCTAPVVGSLTDQFFAAPVDEEHKRGGKNPPNNLHAAIPTRDKLAATRFLPIMEVQGPPSTGEGIPGWQVGDCLVSANLDPSRPSLLVIKDRAGTCALFTGEAVEGINLGSDAVLPPSKAARCYGRRCQNSQKSSVKLWISFLPY